MTIHFEKGVPTAVDGKEMGAVELVEYLNKLGGANGIGLLAVSYTHLDVYKRQPCGWTCGATTSSTTGTGGINRSRITCRISWD